MSKLEKNISITNKLWIPSPLIDRQILNRSYNIPQYNESACAKCPLRPERHTDDCDTCQNYLGDIKLYKDVDIDGKPFVTLPIGDIKRVERLFSIDTSKADDQREEIPFTFKIKFTGKLREGETIDGLKTVNQARCIEEWFAAGCTGIICAPPRAGKTIMGIAAGIRLGNKMIIVAHQEELLKQFYKAIMGDPKRKRPAMTNIPEIEKRTGHTLVKIIKDIKDFNNPHLQICLVNYQKFIRASGAKRVKNMVNGKFSTLIVDEVHQGASLAYGRFLSLLRCKARMGLSATHKRKDGKSLIIYAVIGREVSKAATTALIPKLELFETGVFTKYQYRQWVYAQQYLSKNPDRNKMIVRQVFKDLRDGHKAIIIPVDFKDHAKTIVDMINRQAKTNNEKRNEDWPLETATFLWSGANREKVLDRIENGKVKVLVAIRSMIKQGIDLSIPSMLYCCVAMSANDVAGAPLFRQLSYRPCTPMPGKMQPIVRLFLDGIGFSFGCLRSLFFKEILPNLKSKEGQPPSYKIDDHDYKRIMQVLKDRNYTPLNKPGERLTSKELLDKNGAPDGLPIKSRRF